MWGRNSEAYSECPFLTGEFAAAVIHGMRSDERGEGKYIQAFGGAFQRPFLALTCAASASIRDMDPWMLSSRMGLLTVRPLTSCDLSRLPATWSVQYQATG